MDNQFYQLLHHVEIEDTSCSYIATGNFTLIAAIFIHRIIGFYHWTLHYPQHLQYDKQH